MRFILFFLLVMSSPFYGAAQTNKNESNSNKSASTTTSQVGAKPVNTFEKALAQPGAALPPLQWLSVEEKVFSDTNLRQQTPLILVLFNPSCGHCMEVAVTMKSRIAELAGADIVFITGNNLLAELPSFIQQTRFYGMPNVYVGIDYTDVSKQLFEYNGIPQIMVYNRAHILLKTYYKQMNLDEIIRLIRKD